MSFGAAVIPLRSGPQVCCLTGSSYPYTRVSGSRGFYGRAYHGWLPAPCSGYANHPNRAIDGEGTRTPQIRQTCWLLRSNPPALTNHALRRRGHFYARAPMRVVGRAARQRDANASRPSGRAGSTPAPSAKRTSTSSAHENGHSQQPKQHAAFITVDVYPRPPESTSTGPKNMVIHGHEVSRRNADTP